MVFRETAEYNGNKILLPIELKEPEEFEIYTMKAGESVDLIALKYYGDERYFSIILSATNIFFKEIKGLFEYKAGDKIILPVIR